MSRIKIAFVCHFSNKSVRENLPLKNWKSRNLVLKLLKHGLWAYADFALWVVEFVNIFKEHADEVELHVIAPHKGLKTISESFVEDGVSYHFYKMDGSLPYDLFCAKTHWKERKDYCKEGKRCQRIIERINPDIICLCGAENPEYASVVFRIQDKPIYLIPQTLLNDPKRVELGVASQYRIDFEKRVYGNIGFISADGEKFKEFAHGCNPLIKFYPMPFPTHKPPVFNDIVKEYDFVFFASNVMKNKGIEDVLKALAIVKQSYSTVSLYIIGGCESAYRRFLEEMIKQEGIEKNVIFSGKYENIDDVFYNVQKAKIVVVPGITAALNGTVRESMLMGMPVIVYSTESTMAINKEKQCLLEAKMESYTDLAEKMIFAISNHQIINDIAGNGKEYAERVFGNGRISNIIMDNIKSILYNNNNTKN